MYLVLHISKQDITDKELQDEVKVGQKIYTGDLLAHDLLEGKEFYGSIDYILITE